MGIAFDKTQMRVFAAGTFEHRRAEVDLDAIGWFEGSEKIASATAYFQNTHARRNQRRIDFGQTFLIVFAGALPSAETACEPGPVLDARVSIGGKFRCVFGHGRRAIAWVIA